MRTTPEISWILEGRSPDQIPMARLAEYMAHFATMLGEVDNVHFVRVERACTRLVAALKAGGPAQRVQSTVYAVRSRNAPAEAMRAFRQIDHMVKEDKGNARVTFGASVVLRFPGIIETRRTPLKIKDATTITGRLYALIEGPSGLLTARIRPRDGAAYVSCTAQASLGKKLRAFVLDAVRAHGYGVWSRSDNGEWTCCDLQIHDVEPIRDVSVKQALSELRSISAPWPEDQIAEWKRIQEDGDVA